MVMIGSGLLTTPLHTTTGIVLPLFSEKMNEKADPSSKKPQVDKKPTVTFGGLTKDQKKKYRKLRAVQVPSNLAKREGKDDLFDELRDIRHNAQHILILHSQFFPLYSRMNRLEGGATEITDVRSIKDFMSMFTYVDVDKSKVSYVEETNLKEKLHPTCTEFAANHSLVIFYRDVIKPLVMNGSIKLVDYRYFILWLYISDLLKEISTDARVYG